MSSHGGRLVDFGWVPHSQAVHLGDRVKDVESRRSERCIVLDRGTDRKRASVKLTSASLRRNWALLNGAVKLKAAVFAGTADKLRRQCVHLVVISTLSVLEQAFFWSALLINFHSALVSTRSRRTEAVVGEGVRHLQD